MEKRTRRSTLRLVVWCPLWLLAAACQERPEPPTGDPAPTLSESEIREEVVAFMADYFSDLTGGDPDGVVARYDAGRATIGRNGTLVVVDSADLRARYDWLETTPPGDLWWLDVDHQVLSADAVLTTGVIGWVDAPDAPDTTLITYTGLLVRTADSWRIRHEHESTN